MGNFKEHFINTEGEDLSAVTILDFIEQVGTVYAASTATVAVKRVYISLENGILPFLGFTNNTVKVDIQNTASVAEKEVLDVIKGQKIFTGLKNFKVDLKAEDKNVTSEAFEVQGVRVEETYKIVSQHFTVTSSLFGYKLLSF